MSLTQHMAPVGLGTWQTFDVDPARYPQCAQIVQEFLSLGGTVVDTSPMYGRAEAAVGAVRPLAAGAERLFLATKVWTTGREAGIRQMETSLARMKVDSIDLMQVHNLVDVETHLRTLRDWRAAGRVRYVGVTHYAASAHRAVEDVISRHDLDALQINYSVAEQEADARLLPLAAERGLAVIVNRPFAEGALLRRLRHRPVPPWAAEIACRTWAQLLLKFVLSHPAVTCVIPGTSSLEHVRDNMAAMHGPMPDAGLRRRLAFEAMRE